MRGARGAAEWIGDVMALAVVPMEAPVLLRLIDAWKASDVDGVRRWNAEFVASRETAELRAETLQMGYSMRSLLRDLGIVSPLSPVESLQEISYPAAYAFAVSAWQIDAREALEGYLFAWIENQVLGAVKTIPLGQTDGQRLVLQLSQRIAGAVEAAAAMRDEDLANFAPGLALLSSRHETQYSRLFRS